MPIFWWLQEFSYTKFFTRELTSLAVGYTAVVLIVQVWALSRSEEAYQRFLEVLRSTPALILHTVVLLFLLFHSLTWLNLAPRALVVRMGRRRVPDTVVLAGHYVAWLAATALVVWYLVGR